MNLSNDLISQFVKVTNDKTEKKSESSKLGTVVIYNNAKYVKLDGSELLTPAKTTTSVNDGDRVTVTIKDHSAIINGNLSDPSASGNTVTEIGKQISEFEIIIADKVSTEELEAEIAKIDELVSDNVTIKDTLTANKAIIEDLQAENATITGKITADEAEIENLKTTKLDTSVADITYATITDLEATNANIYNLEATYGDFEVLTTNKFTAIDATIKDLEADKLSATDAELKYANIDFANIGQAAIENFLSKSGMIGDLVVGDGTVTGTLIGVTIKGDLIEGNTIVADKLVIKGDDGLYYKLNTDGETVEAAQTEYNSLNGSVIIAKSVTASKIRVDDLVAFDATIGGFNITENSIYSGVKESVSNTTRGVYLDDDGQVAFGDASNFLKYYKDQNGDYRLEISAKTMVLGSSKNVETEITNLQKAVNEVEVGGRNYIKGGKGDSDSGIFKNFDTINIDECYAEHTLTSQKTYASVNIASGFVLGCRDYEVGSQVTWSYDIMFTAWDFPNGATRSEWWFGQSYTKDSTDSTNTTGAWRGVTYHNLPVIGSNGCKLNEWYHVEKTITIPEQAADGIDTAGSIQFYNSNADVSASVTFRLKNVKLEYGNKATDWTPAIEDVDDDISNAQSSADEANNKADSNATRITEAETLIAKLEDCIAMMVTDENGMSLMTQTDTGWTFNIAELRDTVDSASSGLDTLKNSLGSTDATVDALQQAVSDLEETAEYVRITTYEDEPCIELGEGDSDFKLLITNTRIMFMNGSDIPTYISNTGLVTKNIEVEDELVFGNWAWKVRSNGNLGLVWKG